MLRLKKYGYWIWLIAVLGIPLSYWWSLGSDYPNAWPWLVISVVFGLIPILDAIVGRDPANPEEASEVPEMEAQGYYRSNIARPHAAADYPLYDYPGEYVQSQDGEQYARNRIEAIQAQHERVRLRGVVRGIGAGHLFRLSGYPRDDQNREYLVVGAEYVQPGWRTGVVRAPRLRRAGEQEQR